MGWLRRWAFIVGVPLALAVVLVGAWIEHRKGTLYIVNVLPTQLTVAVDGAPVSLGTAGQSGPLRTSRGTHLVEVRSKQGTLLESELVVVQGDPIYAVYSVAGASPIRPARAGVNFCGRRVLELTPGKSTFQAAGGVERGRVVTAAGGLATCLEWAESAGASGEVMALLLTARRFGVLEAAIPGVRSDDAWAFVLQALMPTERAEALDQKARAQLHSVALKVGQLDRVRPYFQAWAEASDRGPADLLRYASLLPREERLLLLRRASSELPEVDELGFALARVHALRGEHAKALEVLSRLSPRFQKADPARTLRWRSALSLGRLGETYREMELGLSAGRPERLDDALLYLGAAERAGAKAKREILRAEHRAALMALFPAPGEAQRPLPSLNPKQSSAFRGFELAAMTQPELALQQVRNIPSGALALTPSPLRLALLLERWRLGIGGASPLELDMGPALRGELASFLRTGQPGPVMDEQLSDQHFAALWLVRARFLDMRGLPSAPAVQRLRASDTDGVATRLLEAWAKVAPESTVSSASIERR